MTGHPAVADADLAIDHLRLDSVMQALTSSHLGASMINRATGMGTSLDPFTQVEVGYSPLLNEQQLRSLVRNSWFCRRVVCLLPQDMTKAGVNLTLHDKSNPKLVQDALQIFRDGGQNLKPYERRLGLDEARRLALTYARWFGMGYIVLRVNGGEDPSKPLTKVNSFDGVSVLDRHSLNPAMGTMNLYDPEFYQVARLNNPHAQKLNLTQKIHASRVLVYKGAMIHPYDIQLEGDGGHDSVLQQVYEAFTRHHMAKDAISKGLDSYSLFKVAINGLSNLLMTGEQGLATLTGYLNTVAQQMSMHRIIVQDLEASSSEFQERSFAGVAENFKFFVDDAIAASGYPHYKLYGSVDKAALADSGGAETKAWAEMVQSYQQSELAPNDRILFQAIFEALGKRVPRSWEVEYPSIYTPSQKEVAEIEKLRADTYRTLGDAGFITTTQGYQALATGQPLENVLEPLGDNEVLTIVEAEEAAGPSAQEELAALLGGQGAAGQAAIEPADGEVAEPAIDPAIEGEEEPQDAEAELAELVEQTDRADADTYQPPKAAQNNAKKVLEWREKYGDEVQGMTDVGWGRARQLASGEPVSLKTVRRMASFNRHRSNYEAARQRQKQEGKNPWEYAAITAWMGWGGDTAIDWALSVSDRNDEGDRADAATPEDLVLGAAKVIYGGFDNWEVRGVRNLRQGMPEGGLTLEVVVLSEDGDLLRLECTWDGEEWVDRLLSEDKNDALRLDAPKKGAKGSGGKNCKKGRPCGASCIAMAKQCRVNPTGVVKEALNRASGASGGSGVGQPAATPTPSTLSVASKTAADNLAATSTAIVRHETFGPVKPKSAENEAKKFYTDGPDPGLKRVPTQQMIKEIVESFGFKNLREFKASPQYKMLADGLQINITSKNDADVRILYRNSVKVPLDERNPAPGPAVLNGVNIMRNFKPWVAFDLNPATATRADLKSAYRKAVMGRHPDQGGDRAIFEQIRSMYQSLDMAFKLNESMAASSKKRKKK